MEDTSPWPPWSAENVALSPESCCSHLFEIPVIHVSPRKNFSKEISNDCCIKDPPPPMSVNLLYISDTDLSWLFATRLTFLYLLFMLCLRQIMAINDGSKFEVNWISIMSYSSIFVWCSGGPPPSPRYPHCCEYFYTSIYLYI